MMEVGPLARTLIAYQLKQPADLLFLIQLFPLSSLTDKEAFLQNIRTLKRGLAEVV